MRKISAPQSVSKYGAMELMDEMREKRVPLRISKYIIYFKNHTLNKIIYSLMGYRNFKS
jgi:hypothetical protein